MKVLLIVFVILLLPLAGICQFGMRWQKSYNPNSNNAQSANDVESDAAGNIYVLGYTGRGYNGADVALGKYTASGNLIWARSFDGGNENNSDIGISLAVVSSGQSEFIFAACVISVSGYGNQAGLLKYDTSGNLLWSKIIATGVNASVTSIVSDNSDNIIVAGGTNASPYVIKFNQSGDTVWMRQPSIPPGFYNGTVNAVTVDSLGNVYGTGRAYNPNGLEDLLAFRISAPGVVQWSKIFQPGLYNDIGNALVFKHSLLHITGRSDNSSGVADIITLKLNASTGDTIWTKRFNGTSNSYDNAYDIKADNSGNMYIAGQTDGVSFAGDAVAIKYDASGILKWSRKYAGTAGLEDVAKQIFLDTSGNSYIGGRINGGAGANFFAVKYNQNGDSIWTRVYNNGEYEELKAMTIDKDGYIILAGECDNLDIAVTKFSSSGQLQWARKFYGAQLYADYVNSITTDLNGNVYAAGKSRVSQYGDQFTVVKYSPDGTQKWVKSYGVQLFDNYDEAKAIVTDKNGFVYVTGTSFSRFNGLSLDFFTVKLDTSGNQLWYALHNHATNGNDDAKSIAVDSSGNVIVCGESRTANGTIDYCIVKYNASGTKQWDRYYNGTGNGGDHAYDIAADAAGSVYVTGQSNGGSAGDDIATLKYNSSGTLLWTQRFNGTANGADAGTCIEIDHGGSSYVSGFTKTAGSGYNSILIKYKNDASGTLAWSMQDGMNNTDIFENAAAIKLNPAKTRIYLTGTWANNEGNSTRFEAKYDTSGNRIYRSDVMYLIPNAKISATGIAVDINENVYSTSNVIYSNGLPPKMNIAIFDSSMTQYYGNIFDGYENTSVGPNIRDAIAVSSDGNVFLGGGTMDTTAGTLMSVLKYRDQPYELNLNVLIQGFYNSVSNTMTPDTVTVIVRWFNTPTSIVTSAKAVVNSSGNALVKFSGNSIRDYSDYYLEIKHRNSIRVFVAGPAMFSGGTFTSNLSSSAGSAYGNNQIQVDNSPVRFALFGGDVNHDGTIDASDLSLIDNDATNFNGGYISTDLNGDNFVDATDYSVADNNAYNFVSEIVPYGTFQIQD